MLQFCRLFQEAVAVCPAFSYDVISECSAALVSKDYTRCGLEQLDWRRVICELQAPDDLVALRQYARILSPQVVGNYALVYIVKY